ncbi:MAG: Membrane protein [Candidatus Tokpelaia sp. JSC188]|nr:MAG: Membrane protein [Candidatus Tokpelaia sp. JSC188]
MQSSTFWWLATGTALVIELFTGTFCWLILAVSLAGISLTACIGVSLPAQLMGGAAVGGGFLIAAYIYRQGDAEGVSALADHTHSIYLDIGETVHIEAWETDGTAIVKYRGAQWTAIHRHGTIPVPGMHRVGELIGNRLLVDRL